MTERVRKFDIPIVVIGAGGHGKVVADILFSSGLRVAGFLDDARPVGGAVFSELAVVGSLDWVRTNRCRVALGIGDNAVRARVAQRITELGGELLAAIHPRAVIAPSATVGGGVAIMAGAIVNASATVEVGAIVNTGAIVEHDCVIGTFAHLSPNATLGGECRVGAGAHVGISATMLPRTSVGARSIVGGGAVVVRDVPEDVVVAGVPARVLRSLAPRSSEVDAQPQS